MRYLIIGLGIYGSNLARDLTDMGHEIIGADIKKANVEAIKDYISTVYQIDATEEASIAMLPLNNVDLVIVAIGENFGASIKVVALLKKFKTKHIFARAIDDIHESILKGFEIDRILFPEQRAARDLTNEMGINSKIQSLDVGSDHYVMKFKVPERLVGLKYSDVGFKKNYNLSLVAITRSVEKRNVLGIASATPVLLDVTDGDIVIEPDDTITCFGSRKSYKQLYHALNY